MSPGSRPLRLGVDLDNTLVRYDGLFARLARTRGLVPEEAASKLQVRDHLRRTGREDAWTELQGYVYGPGMADAEAFAGAAELLGQARRRGHEVFVVSHRTRRPALGPEYDLHAAARAWIADRLPVVEASHVYLETTREEKIERIRTLACGMFVDDLPEVLLAESFPPSTRRVLFDPDGNHGTGRGVERVHAWSELARLLDPLP